MIGGKPSIVNVAMSSSATEYSYAVPSGAKKVLLKLRSNGVDFVMAYVSGETATNYLTVSAGQAKSVDAIKGGMTIYFKAASNTQVMEIEVWR